VYSIIYFCKLQDGAIKYLVLWEGLPKEASQGLTAENIGSALLRYKMHNLVTYCIIHFSIHREFNNPHPLEHVIREAVGSFTLAIDRSIRVACFKNTVLRIPFRHDVKFLFQDKHELTLGDFDNNFFPYGWNHCYQQHGSSIDASYYGRTIVFLIRIKCYLQWT